MKKSPLTTGLLGVEALLAIATLVLCYSYISKAKELRTLQSQAAFINFRQQAVAALATDCAEYSQKNPAILPILEAVGVKPPRPGATPTPATATPAAKPASK
jgi:hypothetical protein